MKGWVQSAVALLLVHALSACQSSANISSKRVQPDAATPEFHRVFVLENIFGALDFQRGSPYDEFEEAFTSAMQACGITAEYFRIKNTKLALDTQAKQQTARDDAARFRPDATLVLTEASEQILSNGHVADYAITYNFQLNDVQAHRSIWLAQVGLQVHWNAGPVLAKTVIEKMKGDQVLSCQSVNGGARMMARAPSSRTAAAIFALCLLPGCAVKTRVDSNKAADYEVQPKRLAVLETFGNGLVAAQVDRFESRFLTGMSACHVTLATLELPPERGAGAGGNALRAASFIAATKPEAILTIETTGTRTGSATGAEYSLTLSDVSARKAVWKAVVNLSWDPLLSDRRSLGDRLARAIVDRMQKDQIVGDCKTPG